MKVKTAKVLGILISVLSTVMYVSCGAFFENEQNVTINLPPVSLSARAISSDKISDLKTATTSYRVTVNGMVREGTGGAFTFTLPVGAEVEITVECLNSSGAVIVRAKKTYTVTAGENNVSIILARDGDVVGTGGGNPLTPPAPPVPVQGQVTYNGNGADSGTTPSDTQTYDTGNEVTLQTGEPTRAGYTFAGWTSNVALEATDASGGPVPIPQSTAFASTSSAAQGVTTKIASFKMPATGVVLTAQWTPITYTIKFNADGGSGTQNDLQFTVEDTNKALPTATTFTPPQERVFKHWATSNGGNLVTLAYIISQIIVGNTSGNGNVTVSQANEITLFAVWEQNLTSMPVVGSIIMKDGTLRTTVDIGSDTANAIAVVYKVDTAAKKAWAVGKVLSSSSMGWAINGAQGNNINITGLQESNYTDGSKGLDILRAAVSDANGSDFATKYPAWDYACNYGTNQGLTSFQTGWYLPSKQELQEVYNNKDAIETSLAETGVSKKSFGTSYYWSSSQFYVATTNAYRLDFESGNCTFDEKYSQRYVCAIRQFTY